MKQLIASIKAYCLAKYEQGQEAGIEHWRTEDYAKWIELHDIKTLSDFKKTYQSILSLKLEVQ